jgi:hypothetical protein
MALKYLSHMETLNINMQGYELQNAVIHTLTTATRPVSPTAGQIIYNSTTAALEIWNGSAWVSASGDITAVTAGTGLSGGGSAGSVTLALDYAGADNFILAAGAGSGDIAGTFNIAVSDGSSNVDYFPVSRLPFTANLGTVTSVAATGADGIAVAGSPITSNGTLALSLTNGGIANAKLANSSITINGTAVALGGSINVGDITGVAAGAGLTGGGNSGAVTVAVNYRGVGNVIDAAPDSTADVRPDETIIVKKADGDVYEVPVSLLPFGTTSGTVTSVAVAGNNGISVSGSPITSSGTITLGITNASITNAKLANSTVTIGSTSIALGATSTSLAGLTALDFAAGNRVIGASVGANSLTLGGATSTVVIPGNLTVSGTTTYINTTTLNVGDNIITLNADVTGTPTENAGIEIERGTATNVSLLWDETLDRWDFGGEADVRARTFIGALTGNASTASKWATARTITLAGDLSGNVSIDGSANVTLTATIAANSVALGTDTTGNYVATVAGSNGISVTGSGSENAAVTVSGVNASATAKGVVELATNAEAITGTDATRALTPASGAALAENRSALAAADLFNITRKSATIGDGVNAEINFVHNLNARVVMIQTYDVASGQIVMVDFRHRDANTVTFSFADAPALDSIMAMAIVVTQ